MRESCISKLYITRGTTPTLEFDVDQDITAFGTVHLAIAQGRALVVKDESELHLCAADGGTHVSARLTQLDTLSLDAGRPAYVQLRYRQGNDAGTTEIGELEIGRVLEEGVI